MVRTLEQEWNARLEELERLEKNYDEVKRKPPLELTGVQRERILTLAQDLPRQWRAETTSNSQRKEVIRLLIEDVTLANVDEPWSISVAIHWKTGALTRHRARRLERHPQTTAPQVMARIETLWRENTDAEIVSGEWIPVPYVDEGAAEELFRHKVLGLLRGRGLLSQGRIELLLSWRCSGFSVHNRVYAHPGDGRDFEALVRYMMRSRPAETPEDQERSDTVGVVAMGLVKR